jgi:undecaprenyl-diphosphatase
MESRVVRFLKRHVVSLSLSVLSALAFLELGFEIREGELGAFDEAMSQLTAGFRGRVDAPMIFLTYVGGFVGMAILCVSSAAALVARKKDREATFLLACGAGVAVLSAALKIAFQRARPSPAFYYVIDAPSSFSYPSGHAMGSTCVVGSLAVVAFALSRSWAIRAAAVAVSCAFIAGVAGSRVYFGVHFPSDVAGGVLAGAAWVAASTGWFYPRLLPGETARPESTWRVRRLIGAVRRWTSRLRPSGS